MKGKRNFFHNIFICIFFLFNLINCYAITSSYFIDNLLMYNYNLYMLLNSFICNICVLSIMLGVGYLIFKKKTNLYIYLIIVTCIISLLLFAMSVYCNYYGMMFDFDNLSAVGSETSSDNITFIIEAIPNLLLVSVPYFLLFMVVMTVLYIINCVREKRTITNKYFMCRKIRKGIIIVVIGLYAILFSNLIFSEAIKGTYYEQNEDPLYSVQTKGILNHYISESIDLLFGNEENIDESSMEEAKLMLSTFKVENDSINEYSNLFENKNLLLIQMESINNFLIGLEILIDNQYYEVTPNLNRLVKQNIYFNNYYTTVGIGNTSDAELSVMTGLYPIGHSYASYKYYDNTYQALPQMFKEKGYNCYSFHANTEKFYNRDDFHTNKYGFDKYYGAESLAVSEETMINRWLNDEELLKQAIDVIHKSDEKVFSFAITISNHTPFSKPIGVSENKWFANKNNLLPQDFVVTKNKAFNEIFTGYLEYVSYTDYAIGVAIEYLKQLDLYDDTVVILYGDHGIDNPIYNMLYDYPNLFRNNINPIFDNNNENQKLLELKLIGNVPLIIAGTNVQHSIISTTRGHTSLQTTICNLFGLKQKYSFGVDCFSEEKSFVYNPKNGIIFMDDIIIDSRSKKMINNTNTVVNVDEIIKEYYEFRDFNNKLYYYNLLGKDIN